MTAPIYPIELPKPLVDGYSTTCTSADVRTTMDDGNARVRQRFTADPPPTVSVRWVLTPAQHMVLASFVSLYWRREWVSVQLAGHEGLETVEARFVGGFQSGPAGGSIALRAAGGQLEIRSLTTLSAEYLELLGSYSSTDIEQGLATLEPWTSGQMTPEHYP